MKILKNFTDAIAIVLAILIMIYCLSLYVKYKPDEEKLEEKTKISLFLAQSNANKDLVRMAFALVLSAMTGILLRKKPEFCIISSAAVLAYILELKENGSLTKHPNVIIILTFCHLAGAVIYAAAHDRKNGTLSCACGGICSSALALCVSTYSNVYQSILGKTAEAAAYLEEAGLQIPAKYRLVPDLVELVKRHCELDGLEDATQLLYLAGKDVQFDYMKTYFIKNLDSGQFSVYLRLSILIFASVVLCTALCRKYGFISAVTASVPFIYSFVMLQSDRLSSLAMPILVFTLVAAVCAAVSFDQRGRISVEDAEAAENLEEEEESRENPENDPDEINYT